MAGKGTLVADGQGSLTFQGVETQIDIDVDGQAAHERVTTTPQPLIHATYVVNDDCSMVVTAEGESIPFVLLQGGAIAVETFDNSGQKMGIGIAIRK